MDKQVVRCPFCGAIMMLCVDAYSDGTITGAWYECVTCKADSPYIEDADDIKEAAYAAAMTRYVEPNRVLTLEEVAATLDRIEPVYLEIRRAGGGVWIGNGCEMYEELRDGWYGAMRGRWTNHDWDKVYSIEWRCWPHRPTDEERAAAKWE